MLQFGVSRGPSVSLGGRVRVWAENIGAETARPLSRGEKRGTRRVDGVEGSTTLSDAVDAKPDSLVDFHTAWDLRREVQSIVKGQVLPHDISTRFR